MTRERWEKVNWRSWETRIHSVPRATLNEYMSRILRILDTYETELDDPSFGADFYEDVRDLMDELREEA
jgi:hypothetical protein